MGGQICRHEEGGVTVKESGMKAYCKVKSLKGGVTGTECRALEEGFGPIENW